ncbi:phosphoribosylformylglycinamidine cyclo-ligase, partial [Candidatus Bathyarchaeota archaeon]|nr:phosphoribosylformylglycinamidine cyclo-ligase [Candidatus Bathyarchaeota archaeon]
TTLMKPEYVEKYPEISHPSRGRYRGRYSYDDHLDEMGMTVGEALLSPTRLYAPIAKAVLDEVGRGVHGMVHNTGGGQTKCMRLGRGVRYVKDGLSEPDPIFKLIQREGGIEWREMYQDFNMGVGYEFMVAPEDAEATLSICERYSIGAQVIGRCEKSEEGNVLDITSEYGGFRYS